MEFEAFYLKTKGHNLSFTKYLKISNLSLKFSFTALFHAKMNKVFMDYKASMTDEENVRDILTLSWFKTWINMKIITNDDGKIKVVFQNLKKYNYRLNNLNLWKWK